MKLPVALTFTALLLAQGHAFASCTPEEATAKAEELAAKIDAITQNDPERAAQLRQELVEQDPESASDTLTDGCEAYDQRLRELDAAEDDVDA
jgi:hypothetical protein